LVKKSSLVATVLLSIFIVVTASVRIVHANLLEETYVAQGSTVDKYFLKSMQADPPVAGRLLDLTTQKGGTGQGVFGGTFRVGETVELYANLTYDGFPVGAKLVAFDVLNPLNSGVLAQVAITNSDGFATISFGIPLIPESPGTWTAFATAQVADQVVSDFLNFNVTLLAHGPVANFTETPVKPIANQSVYFDASTSQLGFDGDDVCPITEYRWDFGDGNKTNATAPTIYHTYLHPGIYYVTLTVYAPGIPPYIDP
jgi:PKD repeat protein